MKRILWISVTIMLSMTSTGWTEEPDWLSVNDFLYQLQFVRVDRIAETAFDFLILDIAAAGNSRKRIEALKKSPGGKKIILCYMSIGEAEDYRWYWKRGWKRNPPAWLEKRNPAWRGNYKVRYWMPEWQKIILGTPESYLDKILALGFDGVYLDIVDGYEYFEEQGRTTAAQEMVDFITQIAEYSRKQTPGFGIFPQNAEELGLRFPEYMEVVTGIGVEDLYYGYPKDHTVSPPEWTKQREKILDQWVKAGKLVLTTDYTDLPEQIADAYAKSRARGYVPYVTNRGLSSLRINEGYEPD